MSKLLGLLQVAAVRAPKRGDQSKTTLHNIALITGSKTIAKDPGRMEVAFDNAYVLVHEGTISSRKNLLPLLEQIAKTGRSLLIIEERLRFSTGVIADFRPLTCSEGHRGQEPHLNRHITE